MPRAVSLLKGSRFVQAPRLATWLWRCSEQTVKDDKIKEQDHLLPLSRVRRLVEEENVE